MSNRNNIFTEYRTPIFMSAAYLYNCNRGGVVPEAESSRVKYLPNDLREISESRRGYHNALYAEASINMAARSLARIAILYDDVENGGLKSLLARTEIGLTKVFERRVTRDGVESGMITKIRQTDRIVDISDNL